LEKGGNKGKNYEKYKKNTEIEMGAEEKKRKTEAERISEFLDLVHSQEFQIQENTDSLSWCQATVWDP
jgi:DNA replicative helicase MCM subunit Mcm2 (Cdc46/Mcm family)